VRPHAVRLFLLIFLAHAFFMGALGFNQSTRVGAIFAFVEPGPNRFTLRIDEFVASDARNLQTGDWAQGADGHYYSNKAPGLSFIGIPAYAVIYGLERLAGVDPRSEPVTRFNTILLNLCCSVAWTAAATVVLFLFLSASGFARSEALLGALAHAFGTLVFPYDTSLWGHPTAAACLLAALCLAWWPGGVRWPWLTGLLGGFAVLVDYLAVFALVPVGLALLSHRASWRQRGAFAAGAALTLLALLVYQRAIFGGFLTTASSQSNPVFLDPDRTFGLIGGFDAGALFGLLLSRWRGLFLYCPVLLFSGLGAWQRWRAGQKTLVAACAASFAAQLLFVASVSYWWGGMASGPRYLITALPLFAILAPRASSLARWARLLYGGALALSVCNMLTLSAAELMIAEDERNPLYGLAYRLLATGDYPHLIDATNLGQWLGLLPPWDLVAFLLLFGGWTIGLLRSTRAADRPS
jgi:hypothetical protein